MTEEEFRTGKKAKSGPKALRDFHLFCPPHIDLQIKEGDSLANVPEKYHNNLVLEGVLKG